MSDSQLGTWYVYILRCADATLYTGITNRIGARIAAHNAGRGARYTRGRLPVKLIYFEPQSGRGEALRRESQIKRLSAAAKRQLVAAGKRCDEPRASDAEHPKGGQ